MTPAIHLAFRVGPTTGTMKVRKPAGVGGWTTVTLTDGLYLDGYALATEIQDRLQDVDAAYTCTLSGRTFTIGASGANFDLDLPSLGLKRHLGMPLPPYLNVPYVSGSSSDIFLPEFPWPYSVEWVRTRKVHVSQRGDFNVKPLAGWREWTVNATIRRSELTSFSFIARGLLDGMAATLFRDSTNLNEWTWSEPNGKSVVVLASGQQSWSPQWLTSPHQTHASVTLQFREVLS